VTDIDVVVTDLDGTLWSGREDPHPATLEAWAALERAGVPVFVATGRRISSARESLARLGLRPPAVVLNGALALDLASGERFHRHHYPAEAALAVLDAFRTVGIEPCVYVEHPDLEVFVGTSPSTHPEHLESFGATAACADLDTVVASIPVLSFGLMGHEPAPLVEVTRRLDGVAAAHLGPDFLDGYTLTVAPPGLSKWVGVVACCRREGLDPARVLAIGDGPNDRELLANSAVAVAPEDASPEVRAAADHVVGPARVGGWAEILGLLDR
jgi:hydroxymethylpyrimidine pyrophosphatase-like HAD family hydrolase